MRARTAAAQKHVSASEGVGSINREPYETMQFTMLIHSPFRPLLMATEDNGALDTLLTSPSAPHAESVVFEPHFVPIGVIGGPEIEPESYSLHRCTDGSGQAE